MYDYTTLDVLAGSLNLVQANDKVKDPDSPIVQNWRIDQAGQLRSRKGIDADATGLGAEVHTLARSGDWRYGGVGNALKFGASLSADVGSGFDGNPMRISFYGGYGWVMNRGKQIKVQGATGYNWLPAPPDTAPTATALTETSHTLFEFDSGESWGVFSFAADGSYRALVPGTDPECNYDNSNKVSGTHSIHVAANPSGRWQVRKDFPGAPISSHINYEALGDDQVRLWFYCSAPSTLDSIFVTLFSGTVEPRAVATAQVSPSIINADAFSWTELRIARRLDPQSIAMADPQYVELLRQIQEARDRGDSTLEQALVQQRDSLFASVVSSRPYFTDYTADQSFNWDAITGCAVEFTNNAPCDVHLDSMRIIGGTYSSLEGEYRYYLKFRNDDGHQSLYGPVSNDVTVNKQPIRLTSIPNSADPQVTVKLIYRQGGPLDSPLLVAELSSAVTTWDDTITNDQAQSDNIAMTFNEDPPPPARGIVGPYFAKLIAYSSIAHPARYWWTPSSEPWKFPGSSDEFEGQWEDAGGENEEILTITEHGKQLWIYKQSSIWKLVGDPDDSDPEKTSATVSAIGSEAVASAGGGRDYFVGPEHVYRFNGDYEEIISLKIDPIFKGDYVFVGIGYAPPINTAARNKTACSFANGRLRIAYCSGSNTTPNVQLLYDEITGNWTLDRWASSLLAQAPSSMNFEAADLTWIAGTADGRVYRMESGLTDYGANIELIWQSGALNMGIPDCPKWLNDIEIEGQTGTGVELPSSITLKLVLDDGSSTVTIGNFSGSTPQIFPFSLGGGEGLKVNKNVAIRLEGGGLSTVVLKRISIRWRPEERRALTFDSGVLDFEGGTVGQIDQIEMESTAGAAITWKLATDLPTGTLAQRLTASVTPAAGRTTLPIILASIVEGRRFRWQQYSANPFQLHKLRARVRTVPIWLDGAAGQFWRTGILNLPGRMNEIKAIDLDYDLPDGGTLQLLTASPTAGQAIARTVNLPATTERTRKRWFLDTGGVPAGASIEFRLISTGIIRLWGAALIYRPIGTWVVAGEVWTSNVWAPFGEYPALIRDFEIDTQTSGSISVLIRSELPGNAQADRATISVDSSPAPDRRPIRKRVPGRVQGQQLELRISGVAGFPIYGLRLYARPSGTGGDWQWLNVPNIDPTPAEWQTLPILPGGANALPAGGGDDWRFLEIQVDPIK